MTKPTADQERQAFIQHLAEKAALETKPSGRTTPRDPREDCPWKCAADDPNCLCASASDGERDATVQGHELHTTSKENA